MLVVSFGSLTEPDIPHSWPRFNDKTSATKGIELHSSARANHVACTKIHGWPARGNHSTTRGTIEKGLSCSIFQNARPLAGVRALANTLNQKKRGWLRTPVLNKVRILNGV
jgi:hypothetical protein